jgi:hypothetical protein
MPAGTAQVTLPDVVTGCPVAGSTASGTSEPGSAGGGPTRSPVQVNGAGPPRSVTSACAGADTRRYCWSGVRVPVTDRVPGATVPTVSPTLSTWSFRVVIASVPAIGAVTVSRRILGLFSRTVCSPVAGSVVTVGSTGVSCVISSSGAPAATASPFDASTLVTVPARVARAGTAGSATTEPCTVTVLVMVPVDTGTVGSTICADGCSGSSCALMSVPEKAIFTRATAITAHRIRRMTGKMILRVTPTWHS